jgi:hypothetical protein
MGEKKSYPHFNEKVQQSTTFPHASQEYDCTDSEKSKVIAESLRHSWLREKKIWSSHLHSSKDYVNKPVLFLNKSQRIISQGSYTPFPLAYPQSHSVEMGPISLQWIAHHPRRKEGMEKAKVLYCFTNTFTKNRWKEDIRRREKKTLLLVPYKIQYEDT